MTVFGTDRGTAADAWPSERGFVGGTIDASTGLTQIGARAYESALGRFISADPVMDVTDHQQMHGYTYAYNNPVAFTDSDGLSPLCIDVCGPGGHTIVTSGSGMSGMYDHSRERYKSYSPKTGWSGWVSEAFVSDPDREWFGRFGWFGFQVGWEYLSALAVGGLSAGSGGKA